MLALIAQALVTVWTNVLTGTPMQFFIGGSTLISMGIIGCILGGFANYPAGRGMGHVRRAAAVLGLRHGRGHEDGGTWTKQNATAGKAVWQGLVAGHRGSTPWLPR